MKALQCTELGGPEKLIVSEVLDPVIAAEHVIIEVKSASVNFPDVLMIQGLYQFQPPLPFTPGGESAGIITEIGDGVDNFKVGDKVCAHMGWQTYIKSKDTNPVLLKVPESSIPLSAYLGTVGMPGRTAYFGLNRVGKPKAGETLVVSAASGAVGTVVGQLAKSYGCKVIGVAGGPAKCAFVKDELGFDECIDYKAGNLADDLKNACQDGIDIYFENVGGEVTRAVAPLLNHGARVPVCGFISQYNVKDIFETETPFHVLGKLTPKPEHRFFVVTEWADEWDKATDEISRSIFMLAFARRLCLSRCFIFLKATNRSF